jgi:DNA-binding transcriptional ArsR family regulator
MPLREQKLDTGFTAYQAKPVEPVVPKQQGGFGNIAGNWADMQGDLETLSAGFRMESDIVAVVDLMTRPTYTADPTFDTASRLKADGLWNDYSENFLGVESEAEYLAVSSRIAQEEKDRKTLAAAGTAGFIAQMAAGLTSPTMLLPFVGGARGAKAVGTAAALGFAGGVAQELPLQLAQETRSLEESVSSIAMSTVLSGVLGGAVGFMRRPVDELAEIMLPQGDMALKPGGGAIPSPRSAGAAARLEEAPELASAFGLEKTVGRMSPVGRVLNSTYGQARWMMAKLADAGLEFRGKLPAAIGGNVESRIKTYYGPVDKVMRSFDDAYARYWFGDGAKKPFAVQRANIAGMNPNRVKMSRKEFKEEVARALQNGDAHDVAEVREIAGLLRKEIYDPIFKKAQEAGLYRAVDGVSETPGDISYLNRVYNQDLIQMRQPEFEAILAAHYERKLVDEFRESFQRLNEQSARAAERAEDFRRTPDEVKELREQFEQKLRELDEGRDAELVELEDAISDKRSAARAFDRGTPEREAASAEARSLESQGGEALAQTRAERAAIRRRLANLRRAHSALTARQEAKLDKIARAEDLSFGTLQRLVRKGQKVLDDLDQVSDEKLGAELTKLKNQFAEAAQRFDKNEDRIAKVFDDEFEADVPTSPFVQAAKVESAAFDKMTDVSLALDELEVFDRDIARQAIQAALDDATRRAQSIVERRAVRNSRLAEQAQQLDPEAAAKRIGQIEEDVGLRKREFLDQWRERGADDIDPVTGVTNFKRFAADMSRTTTNKILGTHMRLPGMDIILEPRGPELARTLDIDSNLLRSEADGKSFLEMDAERLMMTYVRTMAPDIELARAFGEFAPDFGRNEQFLKLDEEYNAVLKRDLEQMKAGVNPATGKPKTYTQEQMDKYAKDKADDYTAQRRDLEAVIGRMRHTWGVPKDPRGFGARAARIASNVNVLRFMSNVAISSIPDLGRPIMKYGLLRTFKDGYVPFVKALAEGNFTPRQLRIMGAALDVSLHSRAAQVYDIGDYMVRGSKFEKGLEYATSKIGLLGLFDYWTAAMKQISGAVANARAMDAIELVAGGGKGSQKDIDEATRFLAANGIDDDYALRIWKELENGGGEVVGGQRWPNTEDWIDGEARTAYNAMLVREVDNSIVTPGVERPLMVDANPYQRLLFQFKSFGMSSTTKTFLAGAQGMRQGDMAFVTGGIISLALGTLSYYTYANIAGGPIKERMEAALASGEWEVFADEAINRSGLLGIGADIQSAFAATPLADYATFSGERSTRRGGDNLLETLMGPSADLAGRATNIVSGIGGTITDQDASEMAWGDLRRIAPLQNHFLLRKFYDMIEEAAP